MNIIANLTAKQKAVIRRDFLIDNFKGAYGNNATATLLLDFARKHMPDTLAEIESGYNEVYEKRHKRIEERKAALLAKERQTKPGSGSIKARRNRRGGKYTTHGRGTTRRTYANRRGCCLTIIQ